MNPQTFDPFADMRAVTLNKASNGLLVEDLARTSYQVMSRLHGVSTSWQELNEECRESWAGVARLAIATIDHPNEQAEIQISVKGLAKALHNQFIAERYATPWGEIGCVHQFYWEAIVRHLANLIDADGGAVSFPELEDRIVEWAKDKTERHQLTLS